MLESKLNGNLDYDKHQKSGPGNTRVGYTKKSVDHVMVPRDLDRFVILGSFLNGSTLLRASKMSLFRFTPTELAISILNNKPLSLWLDVSTSTITRITDRIRNDIVPWQNNPLEPVYSTGSIYEIVFKETKMNSQVVN